MAGYTIFEKKLTILPDITEAEWGKVKKETIAGIEEIVLSYGLEMIPDNAFSGYTNLKTCNFPSSLTTIGKRAFLNCEKFIITEINIGSLDYECFKGCVGMTGELTLGTNVNFDANVANGIRIQERNAFNEIVPNTNSGELQLYPGVIFGWSDIVWNGQGVTDIYNNAITFEEGYEIIMIDAKERPFNRLNFTNDFKKKYSLRDLVFDIKKLKNASKSDIDTLVEHSNINAQRLIDIKDANGRIEYLLRNELMSIREEMSQISSQVKVGAIIVMLVSLSTIVLNKPTMSFKSLFRM